MNHLDVARLYCCNALIHYLSQIQLTSTPYSIPRFSIVHMITVPVSDDVCAVYTATEACKNGGSCEKKADAAACV